MVPFVSSEAVPSSMIMVILLKLHAWLNAGCDSDPTGLKARARQIGLQPERRSNAEDCWNARACDAGVAVRARGTFRNSMTCRCPMLG